MFRADKDYSYKNRLKLWKGTNFPQNKCGEVKPEESGAEFLTVCLSHLVTDGPGKIGYTNIPELVCLWRKLKVEHLQDCWWSTCVHSLTLWSLLLGSFFKIFGSSFIVFPLIINFHDYLREELIFKKSKAFSKTGLLNKAFDQIKIFFFFFSLVKIIVA